jgi:4'-phosphopantetheinyl transferase
VYVFMADVDVPPVDQQQLTRLLSADEVARARRFLFDRHRQRFVVARALLRTILGGHLGVPAQTIRFRYETRGKPALDCAGLPSLAFNLSHADSVVLIAVARAGALGADVERVRAETETSGLERLCFAPAEIERFARLDGAARALGFCQSWTRKESYLKATGVGLAGPLRAVSVLPRAGMPGVSRVVGGDGRADWHVHDLAAPAGYAAALAIDSARPVRRSTWTWPADY